MAISETVHHATREDAARAFYEAFERNDVDAMMDAWADDDEIFCVHPGGPRLIGQVAVRAGWEEIFGGRARVKFQFEQPVYLAAGGMAVQSVFEYLQVNNEPELRGPAIATNIFMRTVRGWRIVGHHAAVTPAAPPRQAAQRPGRLH